MQISTALISVSDKTNLIVLAQFLQDSSVKIISTGGSAELLKNAGIEVVQVSEYTNFPEIMAGRVKTLQPKIHGGILARRGVDDEIMKELKIKPIDLVIVNLYPFAKTIAKANCTLAKAIENIDIGGPAMIRSAAKNHHWVTILSSVDDYQSFMDAVKSNQLNEEFRYHMAVKAFHHTAAYDSIIANYLDDKNQKNEKNESFSNSINLSYQKKMDLRYGENPHQKAALYQLDNQGVVTGLAQMKQLQGKALSYNNFVDTDAAYACLSEFDASQKACVIVKHANPCGVALADSLLSAYKKAYACDSTSAFGGILAFNSEVTSDVALAITSAQFAEVIIAPSFTKSAVEIFAKKKNLRLIENPLKNYCDHQMIKKINGALLFQQEDQLKIKTKDLKCVTQKQVSDEQMKDLIFAFKVAKYVKSNAIVYAKNSQTLGIGAGQMSRVYAAKIAQIKAKDEGLNLENCVMASDAFLPFKDNITMATQAGVSAIIQPGGSIRDNEVISEANTQGIAMIFSGSRHFRH